MLSGGICMRGSIIDSWSAQNYISRRPDLWYVRGHDGEI